MERKGIIVTVLLAMFVSILIWLSYFRKASIHYRNDRSPFPELLCPVQCRCSKGDNISVSCVNKNLIKVPELPALSTYVYLQNNKINNITCSDFENTVHLHTLDLSHNSISHLYNCSFSSLNQLHYLSITNCSIDVIEIGVFHSLVQLTNLNLASNRIVSIQPGLFIYQSKLEYLDLSLNRLTQLKNNTFTSLSSLKELILRSNSLIYNKDTFEQDAFQGLYNLKLLHIHGNQPPGNVILYPDIALSKVTNLRELHMDGYPAVLGPGFRNLINLELLNISGDAVPGFMFYCDLSKGVPDNMFENLCTIRPLALIMNFCRLNSLSPEALKPLKSLWSLEIFYSRDLQINGFKNASEGLVGSNISNLVMSAIDRTTSSRSAHVARDTFQHLKNTHLVTLDFSRNKIVTIEGLALTNLPHTLKYLSLKDNNLIDIAFSLPLLGFPNLKILDVSDQIRFTQKANHGIDNEYSGVKNRASGSSLSNFKQPIKIDKENTSQKINLTIPLPKNLEVIYAYSMKIEYSIPAFSITNNKVLKYFDYSNNFARVWKGPVDGIPSLKYLDLSRNYCVRMNLIFFQNMTNLTTLLVSQNVLGQTLADDIEGQAFSYLTQLEILDLSQNNIKILSPKIFRNTKNLKFVTLSNNFMEYFLPDMESLGKLEVLDLRENVLKGLTEKNCQDLRRIKSTSSKLKVLLANNNLLCSCEFVYFLNFATEHPDIFDNIECQHDNGTLLPVEELSAFVQILQRNCLAQAIVVYVLISFLVLVAVYIVTAVFYYNRWKLVYLYYIGKKRLHIGETPITYAPVADVFITYDDQDVDMRRFLLNTLLPKLKDQGVTHILGEVNFPGGPLYPSISAAILGTKKTLVLLSRDLFEDKYNELGVHFSIMYEINTLNQVIVPVFMEEVDIKDFPKDISLYLRNQRHRWLLYGPVAMNNFWQRLFTALRE